MSALPLAESFAAVLADVPAVLRAAAETALAAAGAAAAIVAALPDGLRDASTKSSGCDLVTEYDQQCERAITAVLRGRHPTWACVGEEHTADAATADLSTAPFAWVIDPIDGTTSFVHGHPFFCHSIALVRVRAADADDAGTIPCASGAPGQPIIGVVAWPRGRETFLAVRGHGAFLNGRRLSVSSTASLDRALVASGFPYDRARSPVNNLAELSAVVCRVQGFRRCGAAALELAFVAAGRQDIYWEFKVSPWDCAAGVLLVSEAGGRSTALDGSPIGTLCDAGRSGAVHILASNTILHDTFVGALREGTRAREQ